MNILTISLDRKLFDKNSDVSKRMIACGQIADSWHIVVFNVKNSKQFFNDSRLSENVFVYPINSLSKVTYFFAAIKKINKILRQSKINLVVTQDSFELGLLGWWIGKRRHLPLQLQMHTDVLNPYYRNESFHNHLRYWLAKWLVKRASGIRVVSNRILSSLTREWHVDMGKIFLLPVLIDSDKLNKSDKPRDWLKQQYGRFNYIFLVASRLSREKNIPLAIRSMVAIVKQWPNTGMLIVGEGMEKEKLESLTKKLSLKNNIIFLPWQVNLANYYKGADTFILTSNYEGYAMAIVEAMILGQLVIATDVGVAGDMLKNMENGLVVPAGNQYRLTEAMKIVITNKELANKLRTNAINIKSSVLTENDFLENYKNILRKTIENYAQQRK